MRKDGNSYGNLATLKTQLGISGTTNDTSLLQSLEMASRSIDTFCGRYFYITLDWDEDEAELSKSGLAYPMDATCENQDFTNDGVSFYAFDLRGHGRSRKTQKDFGKIELIVEDVTSFLDYLHHKHSVISPILLGHSLGGLIALTFALLKKNRR